MKRKILIGVAAIAFVVVSLQLRVINSESESESSFLTLVTLEALASSESPESPESGQSWISQEVQDCLWYIYHHPGLGTWRYFDGHPSERPEGYYLYNIKLMRKRVCIDNRGDGCVQVGCTPGIF